MKSLAVRPCRVSFGRSSHWMVLKLVAGVVALAAMLSGCAATTAAPAPKASATSTVTRTPTPLPPAPLTWMKTTLPTSAPELDGAVALNDGATIYACGPASQNPADNQILWPSVWVTHDFAAHWSHRANIPADHVNNGCIMLADQLNPSIAVAILTWMPNGAGGGPSINDITNYVTFNGGASWRKLTDPQPFEMDFLNGPATRNGMTYALRGVVSGNAVHTGLWVSSDHMTTWRLIDPPGVTAEAATFTIQPTTGEIFAQYGEPEQPSDLWDSRDGGAHWTKINAPSVTSLSGARYSFVVGPAVAGSGWMICSADVKVTNATAGDPLTCSVDGGKTWDTRPSITLDHGVAKASQQTASVAGITSDGTIVATLWDSSATTLYRLTPGAQQWQSLGDLPAATGYSRLSSGNVIWSMQSPLSPIIATTRG